jgi:hypothetical protein
MPRICLRETDATFRIWGLAPDKPHRSKGAWPLTRFLQGVDCNKIVTALFHMSLESKILWFCDLP